MLYFIYPKVRCTHLEALKELIEQVITGRTLITATLSQLRSKGDAAYNKVQVKPVELKGKLHYQFAYYIGPKVEHRNIPADEAAEEMLSLLRDTFRQGLLCTAGADYQVLISKKYKVSILTKSASKQEAPDLAHNRRKQYVLDEGEPVPFLVELGIMNSEGKVLAKNMISSARSTGSWRWFRMCWAICRQAVR